MEIARDNPRNLVQMLAETLRLDKNIAGRHIARQQIAPAIKNRSPLCSLDAVGTADCHRLAEKVIMSRDLEMIDMTPQQQGHHTQDTDYQEETNQHPQPYPHCERRWCHHRTVLQRIPRLETAPDTLQPGCPAGRVKIVWLGSGLCHGRKITDSGFPGTKSGMSTRQRVFA